MPNHPTSGLSGKFLKIVFLQIGVLANGDGGSAQQQRSNFDVDNDP